MHLAGAFSKGRRPYGLHTIAECCALMVRDDNRVRQRAFGNACATPVACPYLSDNGLFLMSLCLDIGFTVFLSTGSWSGTDITFR